MGGETAVGSELSLVSDHYRENKVSAVMEMASICLKIRHVSGFISLTERSIGAGTDLQLLYSSVVLTGYMQLACFFADSFLVIRNILSCLINSCI